MKICRKEQKNYKKKIVKKNIKENSKDQYKVENPLVQTIGMIYIIKKQEVYEKNLRNIKNNEICFYYFFEEIS